jgi:hypothetical protein
VGVGVDGVGDGGAGVSVGGTGVGGSGVSVGGRGVLVGRGVPVGTGVAVGGTVLVAEGMGVNVGLRVIAGTGVAVGALARKLGILQPRLTTPKTTSASNNCFCFIVCPSFKPSGSIQPAGFLTTGGPGMSDRASASGAR